eukprot:scaffold647821_cov48-Prasinocladus_malaysianus.AAC.1
MPNLRPAQRMSMLPPLAPLSHISFCDNMTAATMLCCCSVVCPCCRHQSTIAHHTIKQEDMQHNLSRGWLTLYLQMYAMQVFHDRKSFVYFWDLFVLSLISYVAMLIPYQVCNPKWAGYFVTLTVYCYPKYHLDKANKLVFEGRLHSPTPLGHEAYRQCNHGWHFPHRSDPPIQHLVLLSTTAGASPQQVASSPHQALLPESA